MEKDFYFIELFELYKGLLTDKQRYLYESHYVFDLSLAEIAEPLGTTRQSVYDALKKVRVKLVEYEKVLHLKEKNDALLNLAKDIGDDAVGQKILDIIGR